MNLQEKIRRAVSLLASFAKDDVVEVCYSGGKDSEVILELAKMAGIKYRAIYRNSTIDVPGTIRYVKSKGAEVMPPKVRFLELVERKGFPTRRCRFCCEKLKEYKILGKSVQGIRREESTRRAKLYSSDDPIICRLYNNSRSQHVQICLPILDWTEADELEFIQQRGLTLHPKYYDADGNINIHTRLGCIACPLRYDHGLSDYKLYPKFAAAVIRAGKKWWDTHPNIKSREKFRDIYCLFAHNVFYDSYDKFSRDNALHGDDPGFWKRKIIQEIGIPENLLP